MVREIMKKGFVLFIIWALFFLLAGPISEAQSPFEFIRLDEIKTARLSSARIPGSSLTPNTIILFSTSEGRFGKLLVKSSDYNLMLAWVTFQADGAVYSRGDNLTIRGTFTCDLDSGQETRTSADFWWQISSQTEKYLTPQNGAAFAIYTPPTATRSDTISGQRPSSQRIETSTTSIESTKQIEQTKSTNLTDKLRKVVKIKDQIVQAKTASSISSAPLQSQRVQEPMFIPGQVLGLRHNLNNELLSKDNYMVFFSASAKMHVTRMYGGDFGAPLHRGYEWWMVNDDSSANSDSYVLPPGVVFALKHNKNQIDEDCITLFGRDPIKGPDEFSRFKKYRGGDIGEGSHAGDGYFWYESTGQDFSDWSMVNRLPKYTVIGLKHSKNQKDKVLVWQGKAYDPANPNISPPPGFRRVFGGDRGARSGEGYYWYEKIDGPEIVSIPTLSVTLSRSLLASNADPRELDLDGDGLVDSQENELAMMLRPYLIFDSDESARQSHEPVVVYQVYPFLPNTRVGIRWVFLFRKDGGYSENSWCESLDAHDGDNDAAYYELYSEDNGITWKLRAILLGYIWPKESRLEVYDLTHPIIYMSASKHHMYFTRDWDHRDSLYSTYIKGPGRCNDDVNGLGARFLADITSFRAANPSILFNNVGELERHPSPPFVNDLSIYFSGHSVWGEKDFYSKECGPIKAKLLPLWIPAKLWGGGSPSDSNTADPGRRRKIK
ncbi:MAG: hypothetical protein ACP5P6_06270 [Candidatus Saccharicenans sp.]